MSAAICSAIQLWSWLAPHFQTLWHLKNTIPLCSPIIAGRGYREIIGPTLPTCRTSHPLSPRNDSDQKIGVPLSQSAHRTVTMGSLYLVIISRLRTRGGSFPLLLRTMVEARWHGVFFHIYFIFLKTKNKKKRKRGEEKGEKKDWSVLPPTELHLPNGLLLGANWAWK